MKKPLFIILVIAVTTLTLAAGPRMVRADPVTENIQLRLPLAGDVVDLPEPCEDLIHIAGTLHVTIHFTDLGDGNRLLILHANPQGAVTQGLETGNIYRGVGVGRVVERTLGPGESSTQVNVFMQVPEYGYQSVLHSTVNANGEVTAEIDHQIAPGFSCADPAS